MRAFARTDPARLPELSPATILKVLDTSMGSEVPITLTRWDFGFLRGLYSSSTSLYAPSQHSEIRKTIRDELTSTE